MTCFSQNVYVPMLDSMNDVVNCPICHAGTASDMDPVYASIYIPGQPQITSEMALCGPCAVEMRNRALVGAEKLPDRRDESGGFSPPSISPADSWAALGLRPNGRGPEHPDA